MAINSGFPRPEHTAPCNQRYVGCCYYQSYWRTWCKVLSVSDWQWTVQDCDMDGNVIVDARVRTHCTPMHSNHFADKPFVV